MRISVAMATFNGAAFLEEQLASIASQTRLPDELIVSDDGSDDATLEIARRFCDSAPFEARLVCPPSNLGFGRNFLHAAAHCTGDWIAFCDQDDVWFADKLEKLERYAKHVEIRVKVIRHAVELTDGDLASTGKLDRPTDAVRDVDYRTVSPTWPGLGSTMLVRAELLAAFCQCDASNTLRNPTAIADALVQLPRDFAHDYWAVRIASFVGVIRLVPDVLGFYRRHERTVTTHQTTRLERSGETSNRVVRRFKTALNQSTSKSYTRASNQFDMNADRLERLVGRCDRPDWRPQIVEAASFYRSLAALSRVRSRMYERRSFRGQARCYSKLVLNRYYFDQSGSLSGGVGAMIKDGLLLAAPLRKFAAS